MVKSLLDYYAYTKSYLILKFKNVVKFHVHIRPIFSCRVTNYDRILAQIDQPCVCCCCVISTSSIKPYFDIRRVLGGIKHHGDIYFGAIGSLE